MESLSPSIGGTVRIYLTGSHSTGKTTLAKEISVGFGIPILPETARKVLSDRGLVFPVAKNRVHEVQRAIAAEQVVQFSTAAQSFVSDRLIDCAAYAAVFGENFQADPYLWAYLCVIAADKSSRVFHLSPRRDLFVFDEIRGQSDFDDSLRIDGALRALYLVSGIKVHYLTGITVSDRLNEVRKVLTEG